MFSTLNSSCTTTPVMFPTLNFTCTPMPNTFPTFNSQLHSSPCLVLHIQFTLQVQISKLHFLTSHFHCFITLQTTCNALLAHFGALTEVHEHYKYKIHIDTLQIIRQQGSIRKIQINMLKILATVLDFISVD